MTLNVYALTNDRAQICAHRATVDDMEAAEMIAALYTSRGYIARIACEEGSMGRDTIVSESRPA